MAKPAVRHKPFYARTALAKTLFPLFRAWDDSLSWAATIMARSKYPEHPFYYGERSNVGWISIAAWEAGLLPLQEPGVDRIRRRYRRGRVKTERVSGRTDLWLYKGRGRRQKVLDLEAKKADLSLLPFLTRGYEFQLSKRTRNKLKAAIKATRNKQKYYKADFGIGVVFLHLYMPKTRSISEAKSAIKRFKRRASDRLVMRSLGVDFIAMHLAPTSFIRAVRAEHPDADFDVGLAIFGKLERL